MGAGGPTTKIANQKRSAYRELDKDGRLEREKRSNFKERLWMGAFGGIALLGPMLLMVLKPSRTTSLSTVCVATTLFTLILAFMAKNLKGQEVLAATATYAAVLVVFIGTSSTPPSTSS
jgi:hypothetical protein